MAKTSPDLRRERLAQALRANLRRRKAGSPKAADSKEEPEEAAANDRNDPGRSETLSPARGPR